MNYSHRYTLHAIATVDCDSIKHETIATAASIDEAKRIASDRAGEFAYGIGIIDTETGELDVGFGFDVPAPSDD